MNIVIVGHGPSLIGKSLGKEIDRFDVVVRLKGCKPVLGTEDYGIRVDVVCLSTEVLGLVYEVESPLYWLYPKKGFYDELSVGKILAQGSGFCLPLQLSNDWNKRFKDLGGTHPNVSTGMASIFICAHYLRPKVIALAGFDTLLNPEIEFKRNDQIPRTGVGVIDHDWKTENRLLQEVSNTYGVPIGRV